MIDELLTVRDYVRWAATRFADARLTFGHGTESALDEAVALVFHSLHLDHDLPASYLDARLTREERERIVDQVKERVEKRKPVPYITGEAWFAGMSFHVDERVVIPRSPLAESIEQRFAPWFDGREPERILDLCTGSGCIAIACAQAFPHADVDAVDISTAALEVARLNVARYGLEERVRALESDLFDFLEPGSYDLIVSNPPYVGREEMASLPAEYRHEPELGLAAGELGLDVAERLLRDAPRYLREDGILVAEVGNSETALVQQYPDIPFLWLDFEHGGHGVFLLTASQLRDCQNF